MESERGLGLLTDRDSGGGSVSGKRDKPGKATFATPLSENMNEDFTVELHVGLLGEGTGCSRPTKASNIGDGRFQPDAPNLRVAMTRGCFK